MHPEVLRRMRKPAGDFPAFMEKFFELSEEAGKEQYLVPYFISSFPGCREEEMGAVEQFLRKEKWKLQQVQDFIPLPMTGSAAMYVTGLDINSEQPIPVVRNAGDREWHVRAGIEMLTHLPRELIDTAAERIDGEIEVPWARSRLNAALAVRLTVLGDARAMQRMRQVENEDSRVAG